MRRVDELLRPVSSEIRRVNYGKMEIDVTVNDPKAYKVPWTISLNQFIALDTELLDYVCLEKKAAPHLE